MTVQEAEIKKIILQGDTTVLVAAADALGKELAVGTGLKTSQIRNIFGAIRQAQMEWDKDKQLAYQQTILLLPKLAYYTKRTPNMQPLKDSLDCAIRLLQGDPQLDDKHFKNFVDFCEAIVAYHRFYRKERD